MPPLPHSAPEAQGLPSSAVLGFLEAAERQIQHLHSLILVRHGHVVAEGWWAPYAAESPHQLFSLSKSFTATAIGLAVAEGRLSLDDPVIGFFPDDAPAEVSAHLAAMRVRHLLSMSTGHAEDTTPALQAHPDGHWVRAFLACPVDHPPGTHFLYNTGATYMLSAILQGLTGITLLDYLEPRLFAPLGIVGATWDRCPRGITIGGFGMNATTDAVARLGLLYLQGGVWQGRQLLPPAWLAEATSAQIATGDDPQSDWAQGYGYQFWRCRHGAYRGDGAFGQYCVVLPEQDAVLAITGGLGDMQPVLDLAWAHLLPAFGPAPLPDDPAAQAALADRLRGLALPLPAGAAAWPDAAPAAEYRYRCEPNSLGITSVSLRAAPHGGTLTIHDHEGEHPINVGAGSWHHGTITLMSAGRPSRIAAAGAWADAATYTVQIFYVETPFCVTLALQLGEALRLDVSVNVSFGPLRYPPVIGHAGPVAAL